MKERFKAKKAESMKCRFHAQTAGCSLTAQQPENNIVRTTIQAMAAVLGGTQSLHTNSMDETLALPTEKAVRVALRTQQILAFESGIPNTIDPLAGSYFVETLTDKMEEEAFGSIRKIDKMGGMIEAIKKGYPQMEIAKASRIYQQQVERREKIVVGVNEFILEGERQPELLKIDPHVEKKQVENLTKVKDKRDNKLVARALETLKDAAQGDANLMPDLLDCARAYCT